MISEYFREIELRLKNTEIITDKSVDYMQEENRLKYRFHLMDREGNMVFRYDNAPHHKDVLSFPHHKHLPSNVTESDDKGIMDVLDEIEILTSETLTANRELI